MAWRGLAWRGAAGLGRDDAALYCQEVLGMSAVSARTIRTADAANSNAGTGSCRAMSPKSSPKNPHIGSSLGELLYETSDLEAHDEIARRQRFDAMPWAGITVLAMAGTALLACLAVVAAVWR